MNKVILKIPYGIQYISQWKDYCYPKGKIIVDKGVTGCGYTEYCLNNDVPLVLCSPRRILLENKRDQHAADTNILYLENGIHDFNDVVGFQEIVKDHLAHCTLRVDPLTPKFMITYDSLYYLVEVLKNLGRLGNFSFVVDEFQSIFLDAFFKPSVEFDFVEILKNCPNVLYLSATPMMEKYLDKISEFRNLPYQVLDWSESGYIECVKIYRKIIKSIPKECAEIINNFRSGQFPTIQKDGRVYESKEAVFYVNSIKEIGKILKTAALAPEEINILCANDSLNQKKLNQVSRSLGYKVRQGQGFKIGKVPLPGEPRKMFTICTKTVYIGADFYSDCASSYVFADPNLQCLALDISLDLPQIVGRQRDKSNPFKNNVEMFYRILRFEEIEDRQAFDLLQIARLNESDMFLNIYRKDLANDPSKQALMRKYAETFISVDRYSSNFVSISKATNEPVYNTFIELAHERAWEVSQRDYQDSINVTRALIGAGFITNNSEKADNEVVANFYQIFNRLSLYQDKLKYYCDFMDKGYSPRIVLQINTKLDDPTYEKYYGIFGSAGCRARQYIKIRLEEDVRNISKINQDEYINALKGTFVVGQSYSKQFIKCTLGNLYKNYSVTSNPKASDLGQWFELEDCKVKDSNKKWVNGFKIVSLKS